MKLRNALLAVSLLLPMNTSPASDSTGNSINQFGLDLHRRLAESGGNVVFSPWSIQSALAMTYAGADGKTKEQMAATLHFPLDDAPLHAGIAGIAADLEKLAAVSRERVRRSAEYGGPKTAMEFQNANRLFGQQRYAFEKPFLEITAKTYRSPMELFDFGKESAAATKRINQWVEEVTKQKIKNLIPDGALNADTRLVLANAIYFKASWSDEFSDILGQPFFAGGRGEVKTTMLRDERHFGHMAVPGGDAVTISYAGGGLQFVLFVPKEKTGLPALEKSLTPEILQKTATAPARKIDLTFPQFKLQPDRIQLSAHLKEMGMPTAFDEPKTSADFSRMAPRKPDDYLFISEVFHKAFIAVDKYGTEAAAATAVAVAAGSAIEPEKPLQIKADHPFLFAIQHQASGTCLFLGRVNDPTN